MASRPKSLSELNNLYDKSKEAQNAIKKQSSAITDADSTSRVTVNETDFSAEVPVVVSASQIASQELSDAVSEFIKTFGETKDPLQNKPVARPQAPVPKVVKRAPQRPNPEKKATADKPVVATPERPPVPKEKPVLISNAEKSELFAEYKRIMNDEDDDSSSIKNKSRQKKKTKKDKHVGSPVFDSNAAAAPIENEATPADGSDKTEEAVSEVIATPVPDKKAEKKKNRKAEASAKADKEKTKAQSKGTGRKIFQILIMMVLLAVLTSAVGTSLLKVVAGVDSGKLVADKYYFFTASGTYESMDIHEGDFVITEQKQFEENAPFVYMENNLVKFALKGTQLSDDVLMAHSGGEVKQIPASQVKGAVIKIIPKLGSVASFAVDNFLILIAVLVTVSLALILVLAFAFKGGPAEYDYDDEDDIDEDSDLSDDNEYENGEENPGQEEQQYSEPTDEADDSYEDDASLEYADSDEQYDDYFDNEDSSYEYSDDPYYTDDEDSDKIEISYEDEDEDQKDFDSDKLFSSID